MSLRQLMEWGVVYKKTIAGDRKEYFVAEKDVWKWSHKIATIRKQRELVTVRPTDTLLDVAFLMWETRVGCVLVTEDDDTLVGIITEGDFLRLAYHFLRGKDREASSSVRQSAHW